MPVDLIALPASSPEQLGRIAELHCKQLPSVLGLVGVEAVKRFYQRAVTLDSSLGWLAVRDEQAVGIVVGHPDPDSLYHTVRRPAARFGLELIAACFRHPWLPLQILASLWTSQGEALGAGPNDIELMYLVVDPECRRQGVGRLLVQTFLEEARRRQLAAVRLGVEVDNEGAIALYQAAGFSISQTLRQGLFRRHRMVAHP